MLKVGIGSEYMQNDVSPSAELSELSICVLVTAAESGEASCWRMLQSNTVFIYVGRNRQSNRLSHACKYTQSVSVR